MTLKALLEQKKMKQSELARCFVEVKHYKFQQQISGWVNGVRLPDFWSLFYMAKILNCPVDEVANAVFETFKGVEQ